MREMGIIHYDEIALKGANRRLFEDALVRNIYRKIKEHNLPLIVENKWGGIFIYGKTDAPWSPAEKEALTHILSRTPGVTVFGIGVAVERDDNGIAQAIEHITKDIPEDTRTFRVTSSRIDKTYPKTSQDLDREIGALVGEALGEGVSVRLRDSDVVVRVEVRLDGIYMYLKQKGVSGLPVGSSGKAVSLLSGGFDSPVATYLCASRGIEPLLLHFHAYPHTSRAAIEKVEELATQLRDIIGPTTLALAPLLDAQKEISLTAPEKLRVVLYRRLMMRVAEAWARQHDAQAIITGDSIGQVASQTIENISAVSDATALPILRPLCGVHKRDIIDLSRAIGTHDISIQPHDDTCTVFVPARPETKARLHEVYAAEEQYDVERLVAHILKHIEVQKL